MDRQTLNRVLTAVARSGIPTEFHLSFGIKDETSLRQRALAGAVAAAKRNAETLAQAAGISLGLLVRVEYGWNEVRIAAGAVYEMAEGSEAPDIEAPKLAIRESVTICWEIRDSKADA